MVKKKIDSIVFDLGGVLVSNDDYGLVIESDEIKRLFDVKDENLICGFDAGWEDYKLGKISEDEFLRIFIQYANLPVGENTVEILKNSYRKKIKKLPTFNLLEKLKNKYRLFSFANQAKEWLDYKNKKFKLSNYFEQMVSSCDERIAKPDKEIFMRLIEKTQINPSKTIFIDDQEKSIQPAMKLGFNVILFKDAGQLTTELRKLGVKI